jgi:hypothetical protein
MTGRCEFYALAHPVDTELHPTIPPGCRWAVYRSEGDGSPPAWTDLSACYGAGWSPEIGAAGFIADQAAHIALKAAAHAERVAPDMTFGVRHVLLDFDPIPAEEA